MMTYPTYELFNRTDLAIRMNMETGVSHVLIETQRMEGDTEITEYYWTPVKGDE